ncbi:hypothetical protein CFO_g734 [Ceratocystis platani]|uniref:CID domain-containing protein n=1 Tax=Ceratocystis fimbriata f. sp. platani TaxID=88771 RepID=A0A0F8D2D2_CERFI|nr:hypothetical protein CFO_g734 [Ceratocystis platani]
MSDNSKKASNDTPPPHFPDAEAKIVKTTTKSAFEKQKADAHAKRQREAAEAAAIYDDFVKSFDADEQQRKPEGPASGLGSAPTKTVTNNTPASTHKGLKPLAKVFNTSDDEGDTPSLHRDEVPISRPTIRLAQLPLATSLAFVQRKSTVAIVTLAQDTPATQIDTVPFGAKKIYQNSGAHRGSRGFAPPTSYGPSSSADGHSQQGLFHVPVKPPSDIRVVRTINKVLEQVLEFGPEFEALLMSRPEVKREERWAWLWDARSVGGIWYRWKLWEIVTSSSSAALRDNGRTGNRFVPLFDGGHAWKVPKHGLPYEYATQIDEFVSDPEYNSDSDSDACGLDRERDRHGDREQTFLNPLEKARLMHLLARLPPATTSLQKGDVARVTAFAITHANRGAAEVVQMVVTNIRKPLALMGATRKYLPHSLGNDDESNYKPSDFSAEGNDRPSDSTKDKSQTRDKDIVGSSAGSDTSSASLVGLYIVSDILSAASNSNVRHAWRFRQLFEVALRESHVFAELGELAAKFCWGRLRADRWRRSIGAVLSLWESWCVFQAETQAELVRTFEEAMDGGRDADGGADEEAAGYKGASAERRSRWKNMENLQASAEARPEPLPVSNLDTQETMEVDGEDEDGADVEGEPMEESDVEGEPIEDLDIDGEDVEGEPMLDDVEGEPIDEDSD